MMKHTHESSVRLHGGKLSLGLNSLSLDIGNLGGVGMGDLVELGGVRSDGDQGIQALDLVALLLDGQGTVTVGLAAVTNVITLGGWRSGDDGREEESDEKVGELHLDGWKESGIVRSTVVIKRKRDKGQKDGPAEEDRK